MKMSWMSRRRQIFAVEQVLGVAGAEKTAGDGDLPGADGSAAELAAADAEDDIRADFDAGVDAFGCRGLRGWGFALKGYAGLGFGYGVFGFLGGFGADSIFVPVADDAGGAGDWVGGVVVGGAAVVDLGVDEGERDLGHTGGLAVAGAGEDDVFHLDAAQGLGGLLTEHPGDGVRDVGLAAAVGADDRSDAFAGEVHFHAVGEGLEPEDLDFLELEQRCGNLSGSFDGLGAAPGAEAQARC